MADGKSDVSVEFERVSHAEGVEAFGFDAPQPGLLIEAEGLLFQGWVVGAGGRPVSLEILRETDGELLSQLDFDQPRPGIRKKYEHLNAPIHSGFKGVVPANLLEGCSGLKIVAAFEDGLRTTLAMVSLRCGEEFPDLAWLERDRVEFLSRTSAEVTFSVWAGLFLSESVARLFSRRAAWAWLLLDPIMHIVFIMFLFAVVRMQAVAGIDTYVWVMAGLLAYFVFNRAMRHSMGAVVANAPLFTYRQVKPVDTVIVRAFLEGVLMLTVSMALLFGAALVGLSVVPDDPLRVTEAVFGLWLLGLGGGLICSVAVTLISDFGRVVELVFVPLYFISGVIFPVNDIPPPYRDWILLNPVLHGVDAVRSGFATYYHALPEQSLTYLYGVALVLVFFGLSLHVRYSLRLATR